MVFKQTLNIRPVSVGSYASFELQWIVLEFDSTAVFCALIYRPPNFDSTFIQEFCEFVTHILPSYDQLLLLGDFNIHVCCPG